MAHASDLQEEVAEALTTSGSTERRQVKQTGFEESNRARRVEAISLRLAGVSYENIGERLGISVPGARELVTRSLERAESKHVEEMRDLENSRLDRAQAAIWNQVLNGDLRAVDTFLRISVQRARVNGLNAPTRVELNVGIRNEMEQALSDLEKLAVSVKVAEEAGHLVIDAIEEDQR